MLRITLPNWEGDMEEEEEKQVWRSIKFPAKLARKIEEIAKQERRSFSAQALIFIEEEIIKQKQEIS